MDVQLDIKMSGKTYRHIMTVAKTTNRTVDEVVVEWLTRLTEEPPVKYLPDDKLLEAIDLDLPPDDLTELNRLRAAQNHPELSVEQKYRLAKLADRQRHLICRAAFARAEADRRGLLPYIAYRPG